MKHNELQFSMVEYIDMLSVGKYLDTLSVGENIDTLLGSNIIIIIIIIQYNFISDRNGSIEKTIQKTLNI